MVGADWRIEQPADLRRAGEGQRAHQRRGRHRRRRSSGASPVTHVEDARGEARRARRVRPAPARRTASRMTGCATTVQPAASAAAALRVSMADGKFHGVTSAGDADRLAQHRHLGVGQMRGDALDVQPLRLLGVELDEGGGVVDLAPRLGERLALLLNHQAGEILAGGDDQLVPAAQECAARRCGSSADQRRKRPARRRRRPPRRPRPSAPAPSRRATRRPDRSRRSSRRAMPRVHAPPT